MHIKSVATGTDAGMLCALRRPLIAAVLGAFALASMSGIVNPAPAHAETPQQAAPASTADIVKAKTNVADLYAGYLAGTTSYADLNQAEQALSAMTGEELKGPVFGGKRKLEEHYSPFRQVTDYYCGPATVQSILWFLGARDEDAVSDPASATGMTGRGDVDQRLLANGTNLRTESGHGTDWGSIVPDTINNWRGTRWYAAFATPNAGGTLHKDQAWRDIQYAVDHGYPVAANVSLNSNTLIPAGFNPGIAYQHWETIAGYFEKDGVRYVKVGQVY
ncbi:MAG: C39 family peptidase, partial [Dehalococcoidia bacterium]